MKLDCFASLAMTKRLDSRFRGNERKQYPPRVTNEFRGSRNRRLRYPPLISPSIFLISARKPGAMSSRASA